MNLEKLSKKEQNSLINLNDLSKFNRAPYNYIDLWNWDLFIKYNIKKVTLYSTNNLSKSDTVISKTFDLLDIKNMKFIEKRFNENNLVWHEGDLKIIDDLKGYIRFPIFQGRKSKIETMVYTQKNLTYLVNTDNLIKDTLFIYGDIHTPDLTVEKIGNSIFSIEIYAKIGSSIEELKRTLNLFEQISTSNISYANKKVTFFNDKRLPLVSYELNENLVQTKKTQEWIYDSKGLFKEYIHNSDKNIVFRCQLKRDPITKLPESIKIDDELFYVLFEYKN